MNLESLGLLQTCHRGRLKFRIRVRVRAIVAGPRCLPRATPPCRLRGGHVSATIRLLTRIELCLRQLLLQLLSLRRVPVPFQTHQHLFFHRSLILVPQFGQRGLVLFIMALKPLEVNYQLVLLLHHPRVVHTVEVAFLPEIVPRLLRLGSNLPGLVQLQSQLYDLLMEALVLGIDIGDDVQLGLLKNPGLLHLVPLTLKDFQGTPHIVLHEKISDKIINDLMALRNRRKHGGTCAIWNIVCRLRFCKQPVDVVQRFLFILVELGFVGQLLITKLIVALVTELNLLEYRVGLFLPSAHYGGTCWNHARAEGRLAVSDISGNLPRLTRGP
mmetsp:Transcript_5222/g.14780  ORF Transcript_5222/g.14780 Transcript_5222/m.14780 type:complete len:328 (+) Transcript_5222:954-1937(+)